MKSPSISGSPSVANGSTGGGEDRYFTSPHSDAFKSKVEGQMHPIEDSISEDDLSYPDSEEETEQAHGGAPLQAAATQSNARVKMGKGGSRAQPGHLPMPPPPRTGSLHAMHQGTQGGFSNGGLGSPAMSQEAAGLAPMPTRRRAGGLSNNVKSPAAAGSESPWQMSRRQSHEGSEVGAASSRSSYKPAITRRTDLSDWAPGATPVYNDNNAIENLPNWNTMKPGDSTSRPITRVEKDMDWSMRRLLSENVFQQLLDDPLGRHRFRNFLQSEGAEEMLDFYFDLTQYQQQSNNLKQSTEAIYDLYVAEDSESHIQLPENFSNELYDSLRRAFEMQVSLDPMQEHLRKSLYNGAFQRFIRAMLIEQNRVKLGTFGEGDEDAFTGLGDCCEYELARCRDAIEVLTLIHRCVGQFVLPTLVVPRKTQLSSFLPASPR